MLCFNDKLSNDPYFNLAAEEYVLKNISEPCFMLWQNGSSVVVGRHQNTLAEIDLNFIKEHGIKVVRRLSGGGAVFHDMGNINFTFIENSNNSHQVNFRKFTQPIIDVLHQLGIEARFEGRNDLTIEGMKFSGNAEHISCNRVLHHGTLLYTSEISKLVGALQVNPAKFQDKAIKSVRSRVTNISTHLKHPMPIEEFRNMVLKHIIDSSPDNYLYEYSESDRAAIQILAKDKYATWEWNFGQSPGYNLERSTCANGGLLELHLDVKFGIIQNIRIMGDFFNIKDVGELEYLLTDTPHNEQSIRKKLECINLDDYLINISIDDLIGCMF